MSLFNNEEYDLLTADDEHSGDYIIDGFGTKFFNDFLPKFPNVLDISDKNITWYQHSIIKYENNSILCSSYCLKKNFEEYESYVGNSNKFNSNIIVIPFIVFSGSQGAISYVSVEENDIKTIDTLYLYSGQINGSEDSPIIKKDDVLFFNMANFTYKFKKIIILGLFESVEIFTYFNKKIKEMFPDSEICYNYRTMIIEENSKYFISSEKYSDYVASNKLNIVFDTPVNNGKLYKVENIETNKR